MAHHDDHEYRRCVQQNSRGNRGTVSGRQLERAERSQSNRRGSERHSYKLCGFERHGHRRSTHDCPDDCFCVDVRTARESRRVSVALRSSRSILALLVRRDEPELSARRPGRGRERKGDVHVDLPRMLFRSLAAYSLRGLPEPHRRDQPREQDRHVTAGAAKGDVRPRLRDERLSVEHHESLTGLVGVRHGFQRRLGARAGDDHG